MSQVFPERLPLATVLQLRQAERDHIGRYTDALGKEQAARRVVEVWREMRGHCRDRMENMNPFDAERLYRMLQDGEAAATEVHEAAMAELARIGSPFTIINEVMSRACGT